jgi:alkanesulfonate monooxygenase SsuD/methylene tetrahydromethanopterin reductase-like flavin-dependent oxidoreductase (luciferase family)
MGVEFSVFVQTPLFRRAYDPVAEHVGLELDVELCVEAERAGFKYAWAAEHHALTEYSHLSSSEVFLGFVAGLTERIHVGSGIWPLNPVTNSPVRRAEAAAMLDHLSGGRFEMGTGRGAGTHEIQTFDLNHDQTRANYEEVVREFKLMWERTEYTHSGVAFNHPRVPHNVLPKPLGGGKTHPPMWVAAGNPPTYEKAGKMGLGVLGFNFSSVRDMRPHAEAYKAAIEDAKAGRTEPVGQFVNDNMMMSSLLICMDDRDEAQRSATRAGMAYYESILYHYHDTFPRSKVADVWPEVAAEPTLDQVKALAEAGLILVGTPEEVRQHIAEYQDVGADQVAFGMPVDMPRDVALESMRTFGREVIPVFDTDPIHRSDRHRWGDQADEFAADRSLRAQPFDSSTVNDSYAPA